MTVVSKCSYCYHHGWTYLIKTKSLYLSRGTLDSVPSLACFSQYLCSRLWVCWCTGSGPLSWKNWARGMTPNQSGYWVNQVTEDYWAGRCGCTQEEVHAQRHSQNAKKVAITEAKAKWNTETGENSREWEGRTKELLSSIILTVLGLAYINRTFV